jgi:hypothetical protein
MRVILAAVLGGIVMFAWGAVSHMVLNIEAGVFKQMPNEDGVAAAMKANLTADGVYFMPGMDMSRKPSDEEQAAWAAKYKQGPTAMVIYHQVGDDFFTPRQFGTQFASNLGSALIAAIILMFASVGFVRGVIITTLVGLAGWVAILVPYWNWYKFPFEFVRIDLIDQVAGWFLGGLVVAFFMRARSAAPASAA